MGLERYRHKRDFARTAEPIGRNEAPTSDVRQFVVQQHAARRMHFDFRLELDGVLKSWAVPKGPSLTPGERRMAVETEDHPLEYAGFEGVIPKGEYGAGTVVVWDRGSWQPLGDPHAGLAKGKLDFLLSGEKLRGRWHLVRMRRDGQKPDRSNWLLIKGNDGAASAAQSVSELDPRSVLTGRDLDTVAREADRVWSSTGGERPGAPKSEVRVWDASALPGARRAPFPNSVVPQLATLVDAAPEGDDWVHEIKLDGYRLLCRLERGRVRLLSRRGLDWTDRLAGVATALRAIPTDSALLDGEAIVLDSCGRSDFQALQNAIKQDRADVKLVLFDCLYLDGYDLREVPMMERKRALREWLALAPASDVIRYGDSFVGRGADFLSAACQAGVEGIVSKRTSAPYRAGRTRNWLKVKCSKRQELVIVGFTDPAGSRRGFGALLMGVHDASGQLRYAGKVGTGFDDEMLCSLRARLDRIARARAPTARPPAMRRVHWVEPCLVAEVCFRDWTRDGRIRQGSFLGLRDDKAPAEVREEIPEPPPPPSSPSPADSATTRDAHATSSLPTASESLKRNEFAGIRLSNPGRVYFPEVGITKRELAAYYEALGERILSGLSHRPLTLLRCPEGRTGECFYQRRADRTVPSAVARVEVDHGTRYAMVTDMASLIALVQIGVLELHVWGARADRLDRPDQLVFDLDPDPTVPWRQIVETARVLRAYLGEVGFDTFVRMTGGKGAHLVVPLVRLSTWDEVKAFARAVADSLVRLSPERLTANMAKARRSGKVFLDTFRNAPEATAIASYSVRARPGAPVALPIAWDEFEALDGSLHIDPRQVLRRLQDPDPWHDFEAARRVLARDAIHRLP